MLKIQSTGCHLVTLFVILEAKTYLCVLPAGNIKEMESADKGLNLEAVNC